MLRFFPALLLLAPLASAHRPEPAQDELTIAKPKVSHVVGGNFETGDEVFRVLLDYDRPFAMPMEIMVPRDKDLENHRPVFAIVGPGLPEPTSEQRLFLPLEVADGHGVFIEYNDRDREVYFERVMRRTMLTSGSLAVHLPSEGLYEVWIFSPDFTVGEFWYGFGVEEDFSGGGWGPIFAEWGLFGW